VRTPIASDGPPKYERKPAGSIVDGFEPRIRELLQAYPRMPQMHGIHEIFCGMPGASECPYGHRSGMCSNNDVRIRK
jgi:hypothetical protein